MTHYANFLIFLFFQTCFIQGKTSIDEDIHAIYQKMRRSNEVNEKKSLPPFLDLKFITINLGMLPLPFVYVPWYNERSNALPRIIKDLIEQEQPSVIFIQEVWESIDFFNLNNTALANGFLPLIRNYDEGHVRKRGMQILLNSSVFDYSSFSPPMFWKYEKNKKRKIGAWYENLFSYERGILYTKASLLGESTLLLATTHLTPSNFGLQFQTRKSQLDSIIFFIKRQREADYLFLGADFNFSPEFSLPKEWRAWMKHVHKGSLGTRKLNHLLKKRHKWQKNKELYIYFYNLANDNGLFLFDTHATTKMDLDLTYSHFNLTVDKRSIFKNFPSQRLDYIWAASLNTDYSLIVLRGQLALYHPDIPIDIEERPSLFFLKKRFKRKRNPLKINISDHFAVMSIIRIFRGNPL